MQAIDDQTVIVYNTDDLDTAVSSDNGVDYVYFGADFTLTRGITIFPGKASLVLDGLDKTDGVTVHTFTDMNSTSNANTLGIRSTSNITVTIKNMNIIGRSYYGIPFVNDSAAQSGVTLIYDHVVYKGSQMTYNRNGVTRYLDCNISITALVPASVCALEEVAEVCHLEIGGNTVINKTNQSTSVFWFRGSASNMPTLTILANSNVTITTANYFMFNDLQSVAYVIESGAVLNLTTNQGISYTASHTLSSFLIDKGATFNYIRQSNSGTATTLYITGAFTVNEGARVYMRQDYANTGPIIRFTASSGRLYINNPHSFVMYSRNYAAFTFAAGIQMTLTGRQLNDWWFAELFPAAGTIDDKPNDKWYKPDLEWGVFTVSGTASSTQTLITDTTFTAEELAVLPPLGNLQMNRIRVLSIGNYPFTVKPVVDDRRPVRGTTDPNASVRVAYNAGTQTSIDGAADDQGLFSVMTPEPIPLMVIVTVYANIPFLTVWKLLASEDPGELTILSAPDEIQFVFPPLSTGPIILPRLNWETPVVVLDKRQDKTRWALSARVMGEMRSPGGYILPQAVVFADPDGNYITMNDQPFDVYFGEAGLEPTVTTNVVWPKDEGILGRVTVPIVNRERYTTWMEWDVRGVK